MSDEKQDAKTPAADGVLGEAAFDDDNNITEVPTGAVFLTPSGLFLDRDGYIRWLEREARRASFKSRRSDTTEPYGAHARAARLEAELRSVKATNGKLEYRTWRDLAHEEPDDLTEE